MKNLLLLLLLAPVFGKAQIIKTIAGTGDTGYYGNGGHAIAAKLHHPLSVKFDAAGNMYIADQGNNVVRKINTSGIITTVAGNGMPGFSGDGGPATNAKVSEPNDIVFDAAGNMYMSQFSYGAIRKVTSTGIISTIAGTGVTGYNGDNQPATSAQVFDPFGLTFDGTGNLYFSDNGNHRVRKINTAGIITTVTGNGTNGFSGDGGPATAAEIHYCGFMAFGPTGELFIPDYGNSRIRKIDASGIITTVIGNGTNVNTRDGEPATAATISNMWSILFDSAGNMYLTDINGLYIRKVDASGIISTIAGTGVSGYGGDGGPAIDAQMTFQANCSAVDAGGNLYIADFTNNRIRRITYNSNGVNNVNSLQNSVSIYPNPAKKTISVNTLQSLPIAEITISSVLGETVIKKTYNNFLREEIAVNDLSAGMYFMQINGIFAGKFVKE